MTTSIVFTFIAVDKPGLVEQLSNTVSEHGGNWLESRMSQLAGNFAGIARVQISTDHVENLRAALQALSGEELNISIRSDTGTGNKANYKHLQLSLIGNDRPGIVKELTRALAELNINVCEMNTWVTSAAMTADTLFEATAEIQVPTGQDIAELSERLEEIANEVAVDINLETD